MGFIYQIKISYINCIPNNKKIQEQNFKTDFLKQQIYFYFSAVYIPSAFYPSSGPEDMPCFRYNNGLKPSRIFQDNPKEFLKFSYPVQIKFLFYHSFPKAPVQASDSSRAFPLPCGERNKGRELTFLCRCVQS